MERIGISDKIKYEPESLLDSFKKGRIYYIVYLITFFLFSLQIIPNDILLAVAVLAFSVAPLDVSTYLFMFLLPWSEVCKFSFGITLSLIITCIYVFKLIFINKYIKLKKVDFAIIAYLALMAGLNLIWYSSLNGLSMLLYYIIASQIFYDYIMNQAKEKTFYKWSLFCISISVLFASVYGFSAGTSVPRWIGGIGFVMQLYGTLGTTRFGLYICLCIIFALFYISKVWLKILVCAVCTVGIFSTVSITAVLLMIIVYLYYFLFYLNSIPLHKKLIFLAVIGFVFLLLAISWKYLIEISFLRPIFIRIDGAIDSLKLGDLNSVTTGREQLGDVYLQNFNNGSLINRIFGFATYAVEGAANYSHNSYIDMLNYCGIVGSALFIWLQIQRFIQYLKTSGITPAYIIKIIVILTGATVSVFSSQYWQILFFL